MAYAYSFIVSPWDIKLGEFELALRDNKIKFQKTYLDDRYDNFEYIFESESDMLSADEILLDF